MKQVTFFLSGRSNRKLFIIVFSLLIIDCTRKPQAIATSATEITSSLLPPAIIAIPAPIIVNLDTCSAPPKIKITSKQSTSSSNNKPPNLEIPWNIVSEEKPFDFFQPMQKYGIEQGLVTTVMFNGCVDSDDNLWFGSMNGAAKYDGKKFTNFTTAQGLAHNGVYYVIQDRHHHMWFATQGGVSRYDGNSFTNFDTHQGLPNNSVFHVFEDKAGNIWMSTLGGGVSKFDGKSFTNYTTEQGLVNNVVYRTIEDDDGNIICGTDIGLSVLRKNSDTFKAFSLNKQVSVWNTVRDKNGDTWLGTNNGLFRVRKGAFSMPWNQNSIVEFSSLNGLPVNNIDCFMQAADGDFWVGTDEGVFRMSVDNKNDKLVHCTQYSIAQGLTNKIVKTLLEDKDRNIWIGSLGGGIFRLDRGGKVFTFHSSAQGLVSDLSNQAFEDKNNELWISSHQGISRISTDKLKVINYTARFAANYFDINNFVEDNKGNLWFSNHDYGIFYFDSTRKYITCYGKEQGLLNNVVFFIYKDIQGNIWSISSEGLSCFNGKSFINYVTGLHSLVCMVQDKSGNLWLGSDEDGLYRFDGKTITSFNTKQGLPNKRVQCIALDNNGNLWLSTDNGGITRFDGKTFANFAISDMANDNGVNNIFFDRTGKMWLSTTTGLMLASGFGSSNSGPGHDQTEYIDISNKLTNAALREQGFRPAIEVYGTSTGFPLKEVNSAIVTHDSVIWACTSSVVVLDYKNIYRNLQLPKIFIQGIKINNEAISWYNLASEEQRTDSANIAANTMEEMSIFGKLLSDKKRDSFRTKLNGVRFEKITPFTHIPEGLVLPHNFNNITIDFAAIEPARPLLIKYQYKLSGYNDDWSPATNETTASFGNIFDGEHTFQLKARSPEGIWSDPVKFSFTVLPPWYRTWWVYLSYILLAVCIVGGIVRGRVSALRKDKLLLEEKVVLRTHELQMQKDKVESTLVKLKSTQAQLIQSEKMASLGELTAGIAHEIQNPLNFVNNFSEINKELMEELKGERVKPVAERNEQTESQIIDEVIANEGKINHHGKRADAIVKGMLQHSRQASGAKELTDINLLANEYFRLAYQSMKGKNNAVNITLVTNFDHTINKIDIIPQDMGRVLLNLSNNAFYAVNEKAKQQPAGFNPTVSLTTKKLADSIQIEISDNGTGIPESIKDKIFQPFFTTKPTGQGTGLGLSLSYDIVKAHGGEINIQSREGAGTTMIIQLPVS